MRSQCAVADGNGRTWGRAVRLLGWAVVLLCAVSARWPMETGEHGDGLCVCWVGPSCCVAAFGAGSRFGEALVQAL